MNHSQFSKWLFISVLALLVVVPIRVTDACFFVPEDYAYSFVSPILIDTQSIFSPYALSFKNFEFSFLEKEHQVEDNIQEWIGRYCDLPLREDVFQVIYKTPISELEEWKAATLNPNLPLPLNLRKNTFAEINRKSGCTEVVNYLLFAKACEPHVVADSDLWNPKNKDITTIHDLMKEGGKLFKQTDSHFIRLRIAYQVIRLAHYAKEYKKVLELNDYFMPKIDKINSIINWWVLGHVAGAELRLKQEAKAAYHFAQVFQNAPSKRTSAFRSFIIKNDKTWGDALILCQSNDEKANLYAVRATQARSQLLPEMEAIYRLNPKHESLEPLLVKAIQQMEGVFLKKAFGSKNPSTLQKKRLKSLLTLIDKAISENQINNLVVWQIAKGYGLLLQGNWPEAELVFNDIKTDNPKLQAQIKTFQILTKVNSYQHADTETESDLYNLMLENEIYKSTPALQHFSRQKLAYLYALDTLNGKAALMKYGKEELKMVHDITILDNLIKVTEKEMPTRLEKLLTTRKDGSSIRSEVLEIKATLLLAQGQVEAANETYSLVPRAERTTEKFSPFVEDYRDCVFCPVTDTTAYTKAEVIAKLIDYDYRARADIENGPEYFYLLGNAWYNMSYFGSAWKMTDYFRSGANWHYATDDIYPYQQSPFGNKENHNLSKAKLYFSKALELSKETELQARAAFMLARIDQKQWFISENCNYSGYENTIPKLPNDRMIYYNLLIKEYQSTNFYQEIIQECSFFAAYAR